MKARRIRTYYTGFKVNSGKYKVMGLAPYGDPRYANVIRERLIDVKEVGSFRLNLEYFEYLFRAHRFPRLRTLTISARVQTVHRETTPRYHALIDHFKARTGRPVIVNTSFNVRGEPIVCTPDDRSVLSGRITGSASSSTDSTGKGH